MIDPNTGQPVIRTDEYGHKQYDYGVSAANYVDTPNRGFMSTSNPLGSNNYNVDKGLNDVLSLTWTVQSILIPVKPVHISPEL